MKRLFCSLCGIVLLIGLCACGQAAPTYQEQYDLGIRHLSEGNYTEAIIAFTAAIEIAPKRAEAYVGLADVYIAQENWEKALETVNQAIDVCGEIDELVTKRDELEQQIKKEPPSETVPNVFEELSGGAYRISGFVLQESDAFPEEYARYKSQYENEDTNTLLSSGTIFLFDQMHAVTDDQGGTIELIGAILATSEVEGYIGQHVTIEGYFYKQDDKFQRLITGPHKLDADPEAEITETMYVYYYNPVGPYLFSADEITSSEEGAGNDGNMDAEVLDSQGRVIRRNYFNADGSLQEYTKLQYSVDGDVDRQDSYNASGAHTGYILYYQSENGLMSYSENFSPNGTSQGKSVRVSDKNGTWLYSARLDKDGNETTKSVAQYDNDGNGLGWDNYDAYGNLTGYARYENGTTVYYEADGTLGGWMGNEE